MPVILCYGDSNTWGAIPGPSDPITGLSKRHPKNQRWPGLLQSLLGEKFNIIEHGLNGRTTSLDPIFPSKKLYTNGLNFLPFVLESHYPIDLVIFMLGTNDTKSAYKNSAAQIREGMRSLVKTVTLSNKGPEGKPPQVLLVSPPPILTLSDSYPQFDQSSLDMSLQLAKEYKSLAAEEGIHFLDAGPLASLSKIDGLHLDASNCSFIGQAVAKAVQQMDLK